MAKKTLSPEEYRAKLEKKKAKREKFSKALMTATALMLGCAMVFCATIMAVNRGKNQVSYQGAPTVNSGSVDESGESVDWDAPQEGGTDAEDNGEDGTQPDGEASDDKAAPLSTPREQYEYFLKAFNNVKKNAKSVEKYWKNDTNYQDIAEVPMGLSGLLETLLKQNLESGDVSDEKYTGADIGAKFPPKDGAQCQLKTDDIKSIKLEEKGNSYIITIECKGGVDIASGEGVGAIASVLTRDQIYDPIKNVPVLKNIGEPTCTYDTAVAVATIDKATGNLVDYYTTVPLILEFQKLSVKVGLQFEEKWKAEY